MAETFNREEFVAGYLAEAEEHLQLSGASLLRLEESLNKGEPQPRLVRELFRSLHTLKGLSAMVGIEPVVAISHEMETILRLADQSGSPLAARAIELLLAGLKAIEQRVRSFAKREPIPAAPKQLIQALTELVPVAGATLVRVQRLSLPAELQTKLSVSEKGQLAQGIGPNQRALRIDFTPTPERAARGLTITTVRERVGKIADIVKVLPGSVPKSADSPGGLVFTLLVVSAADDAQLAEAADIAADRLVIIAREAEPPYPPELPELEIVDEAPQSDSIRVSVKRLDDALESLSALVVSRFRLSRAVTRLRESGSDVRELTQLLNEHAREIRQLRTTITRARMVSMAQLLERVPMLVRGMSKSVGKQVRLKIDAGRAELDKGVAERIFPAILHLIRNAIDHAIELPAERERLGKPSEGTISITCFERADNRLELCIRDDGCGIDRVRVAKKANQPVPPDDATLLHLITRPGLSTQEVVNDRSGRGMGMDIVKRVAVDTLGGELQLTTQQGAGTAFTLRIPLSISILDSLSFLCGEQIFVVPLASVEEIVELGSANILRSPSPGKREVPISMLRRRDHDIPLVTLASLFKLQKIETQSAVVVMRDQQRFAFAVDKMLGQQEVVIRPLEDPLVKVPGVSGTTDLGDGRPTLVLDLLSLTSLMITPRQGARS